jgi:acetyl-CoA carboxylase carboxyl transferase subunit alpha
LTAEDLKQLGIIDEIVAEPLGGAHRASRRRSSGWATHSPRRWRASTIWMATPSARERREKFLAMGRGGLAA